MWHIYNLCYCPVYFWSTKTRKRLQYQGSFFFLGMLHKSKFLSFRHLVILTNHCMWPGQKKKLSLIYLFIYLFIFFVLALWSLYCERSKLLVFAVFEIKHKMHKNQVKSLYSRRT